jgi:dipeptidyl aminopeptidase/acylaminoacyl peptidase
VYASFLRWPEELPTAVEPVEGFRPEAGTRFEYTPAAAPGAYSLVVKVTWEERVEVFYAISVVLFGQTPTPSSTEASEVVPTDTATPRPTPIPAPETSVLRVAFVKEGNVWLWSEGEEARPLTSAGEVTSLEISDDGEVVAFTREIELWAVNSDGSGERRLVTIGDIAAMVAPGDPGVRIYRVEWVPGTHVVAFNTRLQLEVGLVLNDDLRLVDADTGAQRVLLPSGEGGEFYYSPDGGQIALVRSGTITLVDANGGNRREVLTYTPPATYSEFLYYARPAWAADSSALRVVIPPVDPFAQPPQLASVWHLHTDGRMARLIGSIDDRSSGWVAFSPDLSHVAYLEQVEGARPGSNEGGLLVTNLDDGETVTVAERAQDVYGWSPDGQHVAYMTTVQAPQAYIGRLGSDPLPVYEDPEVAAIDVRWIDAERYLFTTITEQGRSIHLGEVGGSSWVLVTLGGRSLIYDFAW